MRRCQIALCGRDSDEVRQIRADLENYNITALAVVCDVSDKTQVDVLFERVTETLGPVDILVNNAGTIQVGPVELASVSDFRDAMDTLFFGHVNCSLTVLPQMLARKRGHIVNIISIGGRVSMPHLIAYCSAKFAALGFSEGLQAELASRQIKVTTILPGLMNTGAYMNTLLKGQLEKEFAWFSVSDSLPLLSIDGAAAARQIVEATRRGKREHIITRSALLFDLCKRLFPGLTIRVLGGVNRLLPDAAGGVDRPTWSMALAQSVHSPFLKALLTPNRRAAIANHEMPGPRAEMPVVPGQPIPTTDSLVPPDANRYQLFTDEQSLGNNSTLD